MSIIGYDGAYIGSSSGKFWTASKFTCPTTGTISSIFVRIATSVNNNVAVGIYNDNSGVVGTLVVNSSNQNVSSGFNDWLEIPISETGISSGKMYWLVLQSSASMTTYIASGTTNQRGLKSGYTFPYWTSPPTGVSYNNYKALIYANITTPEESKTIELSDTFIVTPKYNKSEEINLSDSISAKLTPEITSISPSGNIYPRLPEITVDCYSARTPTLDVSIYNDSDELIWQDIGLSMTDNGDNTWSYSYQMLELDDYLNFGNYYVSATITDTNSKTDTETSNFVIVASLPTIDINSISRNFDGSSRATVDFTVTSLNGDRVDTRFFSKKLLKMWKYKEKINLTSTDKGIIRNNKITGIKSASTGTSVSTVWRYNAQNSVYDAVKGQTIQVENKVYVYRNGTETDISKYVKSLNFSRDKEFNASQLDLTLMASDDISPFQPTAELNKLAGNEDILLKYHNKIVVKKLMIVDGNVETYTRFTGYIANVTPRSDKYLTLTAYDKLREFNVKMQKLEEYNPDKTYVSETLRTSDGYKCKGTYADWAIFPAPIIRIGGKVLKPGEYVIDSIRGVAYIYANVLLGGDWVTCTIDDESDFASGSQIFTLNFAIDDSSALTVEHHYQEKVEYACVDGVEKTDVWVDKVTSLDENIDYYVDYDSNVIYLDSAFPADTSTVKNHKLYVSFRRTETVTAEYYYSETGTNEVEDIVADFADFVGFTSSELRTSVTGEEIESQDGKDYFLANNNLTALPTVYKNGNSVSILDTTTRRKDGIIRLTDSVLWYDKLLDPVVSAYHVLDDGSVAVSLDTSDYYYADASIKGVFPSGGGYFEKSYDFEYFRLDISDYGKINLYLKSTVATTVVVTLNNSASNSSNYNFSLSANTWTKCEIENTESWNNDISYIRISTTEACTINMDYIYIPRDVITIDYTYSHLRSTGITMSDFTVRYEDYDNLSDAMEDLMAKVAPNYLIYVDANGKLKGQYKRVNWNTFFGEVYSVRGLTEIEAWGKFLLEDYYLQKAIRQDTSISDEDIYTSIIVIGKLAEKHNVALTSTATNKSTYASPIPYNQRGNSSDLSPIQTIGGIGGFKNVTTRTIRNLLMVAPPSYDSENITDYIVDNDANIGVWWYKSTEDSNDSPPEHEIAEIVLEEPVYWEEIAICVGAYKNKTIKQTIYIKVEDENGESWFPDDDVANKQSGTSGCYSDDTEVLTEKGWMLFKDIVEKKLKIKIATLNPKTNKVEYHYPEEYWKFDSKDYGNKLVGIKNSFIDLLVTPDHNCWVSGYNHHNWHFQKAKDLNKCVRMNRNFPYNNKEEKYFILPEYNKKINGKNQHSEFDCIRTISAKKILMNDWLEFLGWYLSEGCCWKDTVTITQVKENNVDNIIRSINNIGFNCTRYKKDIKITSVQLVNYLKQFGKAKDKFIPREILNNISKKQCQILLQSLMLGDGSKDGFSYFTVSPELANNVQELVLKAGYCSSIYVKKKFHKSHYGELPLYRVSICKDYKYIRLNQKTNSINEQEYKGKVYCLTVPNHIMYVRRNGKGCFCGNTWLKWKNTFHNDKKIAKAHIYLSEPWFWYETSGGGGKK